MSPLKNELILCTQTYNDTKDFRSFGNTILNECYLNATMLWKENNYPIYFYQLYINLPNETLIEVPVIIENYYDNTEATIDCKKPLKERHLFKRFFTIYNDIVSGGGNILLYARNITFNVELINSRKGISQMKMPYLSIYYSTAKMGAEETIYFSFLSDYTMDLKRIMKISLAFLLICLIATFAIITARMYVWVKLNPYELTERNYAPYFLITLIFKSFKYYGIIFFFYSWGLSAFWFIFYKLQYRPYVFLPSFWAVYKEYYKKFYTIWGVACCGYGLYIMYRIYEQVNSDIFFIDWEHDKNILENVMGKTSNKAYKSPWRSIHIVNQFNLLQKSRTISIPFCFLLLIMCYYSKSIGFDKYGKLFPAIYTIENSVESIILRHFFGTFILFISGTLQYVLRRLVQIWIPTRKTEFLDLCSVANISVLILKESLRGYYIHGQSPLGVADTTLQQLIQFLEEEGKGKIRGRGLTDEKSDDLQTYEIYLSFNMRQIYDGLYFLPTLQEIDRGNQKDQMQTQAKFRNIFQYIPKSLSSPTIYQINKFMNNHLKTKIEQVTMQSKVLIKEKTLCERFFEFPPSIDLASRDVKELVFYKDKGENFDDILFIGMELEFLIFVIYVWEMWVIALQKYGRSMSMVIFLTYVMEQMFFRIRIFFGEKNVAKKAVIDNRFL